MNTIVDRHMRRRIATVAAALDSFVPGEPSFEAAVRETVERHGYTRSDVESQIVHVCATRCSAKALEASLEGELAAARPGLRMPNEVVHLVAGTVPALSVESLAVAYVIGARSQVRPSREETVLAHFLQHAAGTAPALAGSVELVHEPRWATADAAVVYGSDETLAFVRERMDGRPVAGYGSREGIAVVAAGAPAGWAARLADDVLTFRQRGCMSPSHLFVPAERASQLTGELRAALAERLPAHTATRSVAAAAERQERDAAALDAISGHAPEVLELGPARLSVRCYSGEAELGRLVPELGTLLQTAVLACAQADRSRITRLLSEAGCSRVAEPGTAHMPPPEWPHDGIGRFRPLLEP